MSTAAALTIHGPIVRVTEASGDGHARLAITDADTASIDALTHDAHVRVAADGPRTAVSGPASTILACCTDELAAAVKAAITAYLSRPDDIVLARATLPVSQRTVIQAVLNVTPDSFYDGGVHYDPASPTRAVEDGLAMVDAGADIIDVGGESTRPGSDPVDVDEELRRVTPVVEALSAHGVIVSIDTTKARVARTAIDAGAQIVNDVSAGALDEHLIDTVAELDVAYILMHMLGTPRTMQHNPTYADVVGDIHDYLARGIRRLERAGIARGNVIVDPGIGFGKTVEHNVMLLRHLRELTSLGRPVLVGASRKSFLGHLAGLDDPDDRLEASLAAAVLAISSGASIVRVHDVAATTRAAAIADAVTDTVGHAADASADHNGPTGHG